MASASISPKYDASTVQAFALQGSTSSGSKWLVASRALAKPFSFEILRKLAPAGSNVNDHVIVRVTRTEISATTLKPVTGLVSLDISIPRDSVAITPVYMADLIAIMASAINDYAAVQTGASRVNANALLSGIDL